MSNSVGQREILTQKRVIAFFQNALGYAYLGHRKDRPDNANIKKTHLSDWLTRHGHSKNLTNKVRFESGKAAALGGSKMLFDANRKIYEPLRYGVNIRPGVGEQTTCR